MKFALLDDDNLLDQVGMVQQDALLLHHAEAHDIAVFARQHRSSVPSGSRRIVNATPTIGRPFGPGGLRLAVPLWLRVRSSSCWRTDGVANS